MGSNKNDKLVEELSNEQVKFVSWLSEGNFDKDNFVDNMADLSFANLESDRVPQFYDFNNTEFFKAILVYAQKAIEEDKHDSAI